LGLAQFSLDHVMESHKVQRVFATAAAAPPDDLAAEVP
jgi:hypothetical protein